jgi:ADP-ribose pyrophosphatase
MSFRVIQSENLFEGKVFNVRRDQVELPDGRETHLDIVEHRDAVTLAPIDEQGNIWFVKQYRHPAGRVLLELPAGVVEEGEDPEQCALREVREEIGMSAGSLQKIGEFYLAPGYSTEMMHVYLARQLKPDPLKGDLDEFLTVEKIASAEAVRMAEANEIRDVKTLATICLAKPYLD